jgi:hypothetical protein
MRVLFRFDCRARQPDMIDQSAFVFCKDNPRRVTFTQSPFSAKNLLAA